MRSRNTRYNLLFGILSQVVSIILGVILPLKEKVYDIPKTVKYDHKNNRYARNSRTARRPRTS